MISVAGPSVIDPPHGRRFQPRLVAKHQHDSGGLRVHLPQGDPQRRRTPGAEIIDDNHVDSVQRHRVTHFPRGAAECHDQLVEAHATGEIQGRAE